MALTDTGRLGCGRDVDDLWAHIDQEPDEHEAGCPDCQAARADLAGLASATTAMVDSDEADSRLVARPGALAAIVAIARTEVRRGRTLPLLTASADRSDRQGELTISEQAVASVVREASDGLGDVEGRGCRVRVADDEPGRAPTAVGSPTALAVELSLTVGAGCPSLRSSPSYGAASAPTSTAASGCPSRQITIHVEDLHDA